ncbi:chromosome-associated kinesin KIF4-like isoform X1 [Cimex lectularius]|uniref:Kinesin motor domain-containing protein n=1 Tax=Cimex lectularius TaxID=79782 RepID=A0A8I6SSN5_CIMLE|nr:chromosome-associated kinesin KIF4-like isoform X1 [Cimex lectularius]XP_024081681.1 chromosome-associated kinesin KIF4-like isoform X1 [Cimex lectularius]
MDSVKVAVRIRPLVKSETESGCRSCIERIPNEPQISIGKASQMFTFNYVFDEFEGQSKVYNCAVKHLIENLFKGYNLTILAYGQTGSGKTYTMGTNYSGDIELGVIPRAVYDIFDTIETKTDYSYRVTCSFLELYNESLYDLLTNKPREQSVVDMREQHNGVCIPGLTEVEVHSPAEALSQLQEGSQGRVVGATAMNAQSSRSHAIFTFNIRITNKQNPKEVMTSKFHLVDLAGSERSKKTGATGDRFKEGVNINKGLMVLGNVISQLCDGTNSFINYRDSKLTRLLQDSLGGNSVTLMIACVSPADYNQDESVSTLRYADRAKKIKNKPVVNQDSQSAEISKLKKELEDMRLKFIEGGGVSYECPPSHKQLEQELEDAQTRIKELLKTLTEYMSQSSNLLERAVMAEKLEETMKEKFSELTHLSESINADSGDIDKNKILQDIKTKILEVQVEVLGFFEVYSVPEEVLRTLHVSSKILADCMKDVQRLQCEKEMLSHEKLSGNNKSPFEEDVLSTPIRHEHILSQAKINKEIYQITKNLVWKEELMAKLSENVNGLGVIEGVSQKEVDDLKKQVESLQAEKDELLSQINNAAVNSANNASKVAEQRRKRLHELEQQKTTLLKKIAEQEKIIKMKQNSDEKMKALQADIMSMKQLKVKLIHQMKSENEKFRTWKVEKDREMCVLRSQNVKRQNQLKKLEQQHSLQQNVLKRKLEAAAAANKRIMAVLDRQKQAKMRRLKGPASERIKEKMQEELELLESEYQAQRSLDSLIQDRASLTKELTIVKESLQDNSISQEEKEKLAMDMKQIEEGIANRSAEISDLQQKLLDIHHGDRPKGNWDMLQSMGDAKFAVSYLFSLVSEKIKENLNTAQSVSELKEQQHEYVNQLDLYSQKMEIMAANHKEELENLEKECEEKVYILLKRIQEPNLNESEEIVQYKNIKYEELEKIGMLRNRVKELEEEVDTLNKALVVRKPPSTHMEAFENFLEQKDTTFTTSKGTRKSKKKTQTFTYELADEERLRAFDDSVEIENDDPNNDPDWVRTPLYKRLQSLKASKRRCNSKNKTNPQCSCQEECSPKSCPCKKDDLDCNENCSCDSACKLKDKSNLEASPTKKQKLMEPLASIRARRDDYFL